MSTQLSCSTLSEAHTGERAAGTVVVGGEGGGGCVERGGVGVGQTVPLTFSDETQI